MASNSIFKHWPTMLLGLVVAAILLVAVFSFQLNQTETAVVTTFGRPSLVTEPGLHFRWPYPFQRIYHFDKRIRCFEGGAGKLEETLTSDGHNILVGIFVNYQIVDAEKFFSELVDITNAEDKLNTWMRSAKNAAFGQFKFSQIISTDPKEMRLSEIQARIETELARQTAGSGLKIVSVGINTINIPKSITEKVFERMVAERTAAANKYIGEGNSEAKNIRIKADSERAVVLANAEAQAKTIRAEGDAEAATHYKVFKENPELAEFLRKLDALRVVMRGRTTVVFDTKTAPFDLFNLGAEILKK